MENMIHRVVNHNLLLIFRIINHNLILTTNINSIVRIEEHKNIFTKIITIGTKWENMAIFIVEYLHLTEKVPIISLGGNYYARKKNPTYSSET